MGAPEPKHKKRTPTARSRRGCQNCKVRRFKCGEERPCCKRCLVSGWRCIYGDSSLTATESETVWPIDSRDHALPIIYRVGDILSPGSTSKDNSPRTSSVQYHCSCQSSKESPTVCSDCIKSDLGARVAYDACSSVSSISSPAPSLTLSGIPENRTERRLLHYFCAQAAPDLSGYRSFNFWNNLVLPSTHQEPGIQHAVLALSAFHRSYAVDGAVTAQDRATRIDSLHQYVSALRQIQTYISTKQRPSKKTVLICCVLFYCIEISRGDYDTALRHVKSGLAILQHWKAEVAQASTSNMNHGPNADIEDLSEIFSRLDLQIRIFEAGKPPISVLTTEEERSGAARCVPASFKNLKEAWAAMDKLTNWTSHMLAQQGQASAIGGGKEVGNQKSVLQGQVTRWGIAFAFFMKKQKKRSDMNKYDKTSAAMVNIGFHSVSLLLHFSVADGKKSSVDVNYHFEKILGLAEAITDVWGKNEGGQPRGLSFETGLVPAMWLLLLRCDDRAMQGRAIRVMRNWDRKEGAWDGQRIADVFEKVQKGGLHARLLRYPYLIQ